VLAVNKTKKKEEFANSGIAKNDDFEGVVETMTKHGTVRRGIRNN
jgi:hypothetical protein